MSSLVETINSALAAVGPATESRLRDLLAGCLLDEFCELERNGKSEVAELRFRWRIGSELLHLDAEQLARGVANSLFEFLLQVE